MTLKVALMQKGQVVVIAMIRRLGSPSQMARPTSSGDEGSGQQEHHSMSLFRWVTAKKGQHGSEGPERME